MFTFSTVLVESPPKVGEVHHGRELGGPGPGLGREMTLLSDAV